MSERTPTTGTSGPSEPTDEELFARYASGDRAAFRHLFKRYGPLLRRILARRVREDLVDDMVQQAFLQLHRARNDFREGGRLRPWLVAIALNTARQHFRKASTRREVALPDYEGAEGSVQPVDITRAEDVALVRAALTMLPDGQREAIELHWLSGLSFQEVAEAMGISHGAVKVRAHRGYTVLRKAVEKMERNPGLRSRISAAGRS